MYNFYELKTKKGDKTFHEQQKELHNHLLDLNKNLPLFEGDATQRHSPPKDTN